ncbi:MAG: bifunctional diguanylate cyclase/phosphodiesterase, partial [Pseudomonadota bacterium]
PFKRHAVTKPSNANVLRRIHRVGLTLPRFDLRYILTGIAFIIAAWVLWRQPHKESLIGIKIAASGFMLYGFQMFHIVAVNVWQLTGREPVFYLPYIGLLDLLTLSLVSLGLVIWLFESQRQRTHLAQSELAFARTHDPVTRLPNRRLLTGKLHDMLELAKFKQIAIISISVNRFALVHRTFGWQQAEELMLRIANRMQSDLHSSCVIGRVAERDFLLLRPTLDEPDALRAWCEDLLDKMSRPISIHDSEFFIGLSAGISLYPDDGSDAETLIERSQRALMQSTMFGRGVIMHHQLNEMEPLADEASLQIEGELRRAVEERQFVLYFQPIVRSDSGCVSRFEALVRWQHPVRGLLGPDRFIDEAHEIGLLDTLEDQIMDMALHQLSRWHQALSGRGKFGDSFGQNNDKPGLSLNLSAQRFQQPNIAAKVQQACVEHAIDPRYLELEITENAAIRDLQRGLKTIRQLQELGIQVALDDFGTGYSSLAHLRQLQVDTIKLDLSFLKGAPSDPRQRKLVSAVIDLCHQIDMCVVAEGVERVNQLDFLVYSGCDLLQGYLLQPPKLARECRFEFDLSADALHLAEESGDPEHEPPIEPIGHQAVKQ